MKLALCFLLSLCGNALSGFIPAEQRSVLSVVRPNHFLSPSFFSVPATQFTLGSVNSGSQPQGRSQQQRPRVVNIPANGSGPITIRLELEGLNGNDDEGDNSPVNVGSEGPSDDAGDSNDIDTPSPVAEENDDQNEGAPAEADDSQNDPEEAEEPEETPAPIPNQRTSARSQNNRRPSGRNSNSRNNNRAPSSRSNTNNRGRPSPSVGGPGSPFSDISIVRAIDLGEFELEPRDRNPNQGNGGRRGNNNQVFNEDSPNEDDDAQDDETPAPRPSGRSNNRGRTLTPNSARQRGAPTNRNRNNSGNGGTARTAPRRSNNRSNQASTGRSTPNRSGNRAATGRTSNSRQNSPSQNERVIQFNIIQPATITNDAGFQAPPLFQFLSA